ncbi:hypothetical protein [Nonomuraea sp. LPB2021202275-12-8]|uniref:hypothetical protein n=1 Tax=Nonomuraea sp. LPB2021202275-12-8 TaxID=3120159 RepID=UPI00300D7AD1
MNPPNRKFKGAPFSLEAVGRMEGRASPISVLDLISIQRRDVIDNLTSGDVSARVAITFASNGQWAFSARLGTEASVLGDEYVLMFWIETPEVFHRGGRLISGELDVGDSVDKMESGIDPWVRDNWDLVRDAPIKMRLVTWWDVDIFELLPELFTAMVLGLGIINTAGGGKLRPCENNPHMSPHDLCVEVRSP